ncbi:MAG TPA: twin-arginine translocase subunit TatC [Polyangiaceae bacterium]|jgi:sec-independent protein translocase protein TatC
MTTATSPDPDAPERDVKMTIWEHLDELRKRVIRAALALIVSAGVCWSQRTLLLAWLVRPYEKAWIARNFPGAPELQTLSPADVFVGYLQLSLVGGVVIAIPVIFYQLWSFISPGLYSREKRLIVPFVFFSSALFASGVAFAYYVAFPFTFNYFFSLLGQVDQAGTVLTQRPTLEFYLDFSTQMLLAFGFVFELPLFISFLVIAGIVTPRQLLGFSRWAVVGSFALGAVVTPGPEISSQLAVSGALVGLYFLSIGIAFILKPNAKKPEEPKKNEGGPPAAPAA